jgi:hypothetical protein
MFISQLYSFIVYRYDTYTLYVFYTYYDMVELHTRWSYFILFVPDDGGRPKHVVQDNKN